MSREQAIKLKKKTDRNIALKAGRSLVKCDPGDEIVISGFSGSFPNADGLPDFAENLLNKKDLLSDDDRRWTIVHPEIPRRTGKLKTINKFDAAFFGIHYKQAQAMDPMCRIILEKSYEAIVDSGNSPMSLKGSKTGVFMGTCFSESQKTWFIEKLQLNGFGLTGCTRAMLANRVSYWLGINGPSYTVDSGCSASLYALENAYKSIRNGYCDSALVGGCNLCLHPYLSLNFARIGALSMDGQCRSFDEAANGYARSEAVCVLYLQKMKNAKRVYARVIHAKTNNDGYKEQGITYPSGKLQQRLLEEFYDECEIKPSDIAWVEAHGTGTKVGDPEEVNALENVFCPGRKAPLIIGSVKSNMGHAEPASGICGIAKVIIAMETGFIPPNLNFNIPRKDITAFHNGRIKVLTEKTQWNGGMVGINSYGIGGGNCHILLDWNKKSKINNGLPEDNLPRLVIASGRTQEAVNVILNDILSRPLDKEYVRLLQDVQAEQIPGHHYRGYTIITKDIQNNHYKDVKYYSGQIRPVCFLFSGIESQWFGMGISLMQLSVFYDSILNSHAILNQFGIDLIKIITDCEHSTIKQNTILSSFVGITAMQIAFFDVLVAIGITPDIVIGHSIGELGCAYADGYLTAAQILEIAYYYGLTIMNSKNPSDKITVSDIGYNIFKHITALKDEVEVPNPQENSIISGLEKAAKLKFKNGSTQKVNVRHSKFSKIEILSLLENFIRLVENPKLRAKQLISTSDLEKKWETDIVKFCSVKNYTKNLFDTLGLDKIFDDVPDGSVLIEVAPHGVFHDFILNRIQSQKNITYIDLAVKDHENGTGYLLSALGKLFEAGLNPRISRLYPEIEFPVSRGTPMIAPLVRWDHSEDWYVTTYRMRDTIKSGHRNISISLNDDAYEYLSGHVIDGRNLFPGTGYLVMAWETLAMMHGKVYTDVSVVFKNVRFQRITNIFKGNNIEFFIKIQKCSGLFEIVESGTPVVTGHIHIPNDVDSETIDMPPHPYELNDIDLNINDIYKELKIRGFNYTGLFKSLNRVNLDGTVGKIGWYNNWVTFMDSMIQTTLFRKDTRSLFVGRSLQKVFINVNKHELLLTNLSKEKLEIPVYVYPELDLVISGGVEMKGIQTTAVPCRKSLKQPVIEKYTFVPDIMKMDNKLEEILRIVLDLVIENVMVNELKIVEILNKTKNFDVEIISPIIHKVLADIPLIQPEISILSDRSHPELKNIESDVTVKNEEFSTDQSVLLVIGSGILEDAKLLKKVFATLKPGGFLLTREQFKVKPILNYVDTCLDFTFQQDRLLLVREPQNQNISPLVIELSSKDFSWLPVLNNFLKTDDTFLKRKVILVAEKDPKSGIIGLFNCLRKEPGGERIRCVFVMDECAPDFSLDDPFYKTQLKKDLAINIYKNKVWGSYRHLLLEPYSIIEVQHAYVKTSVDGDLSSLKWVAGSLVPYSQEPEKSNIIHVYYSSLNFKDIMLASGKLVPENVERGRRNLDSVIGFEYSGRTETGDRVMGMVSCLGLTNLLNCDPYLSWRVPDNWSLEDAATVPVVYGTAIYALIINGRMTHGNSILIHAGTGGVGQAAITLALYYKCNVFTTVGTPEKREFIKSNFPQIPHSHIGNSRDTSFEKMIMTETRGKGVDIVLNSLAEDMFLASIRCLTSGGRFLEIGKFDLANNIALGMEVFLKEISFHGVMLDVVIDGPKELKLILQNKVQDYIDSGAIKPLVRTVFENDKIEQAFRYMGASKHIGKVLIKVRPEEDKHFIKPLTITKMAYPRVMFDTNSSCIICGGLGGFGLELADWMILRNARNIILNTRTGIRTGYQAMRKRIWESNGVNVIISTADITTEEGVKQLINEATKLGPVSSIFNLAVVIKAAIFENQTEEDFVQSFLPKAIATSLLDKYSRIMCPELQYFVMFSSISCGRGAAGLTSYGMSNSIMERICEVRQSESLPALAIEWGPIGEVGLVADMVGGNEEIVVSGTAQQKISNCLEILDNILTQKNCPIICSMIVADKYISYNNEISLVNTVMNILGLRDLKSISLNSTLPNLGMDSMMVVEIRQILEKQFEIYLTPRNIKSMTFAKLQKMEDSGKMDINDEIDPKFINQIFDIEFNYLTHSVGEKSTTDNPIVCISPLHENCSTVEQHTHKKRTLFIVPGLEGVASMMEPLCKNLNMQIYCFQYENISATSTIEELAANYYPLIEKQLVDDQEFLLLGYSFGGIVALEILKLLEKNNRKGKLWLIDSSPQFMKAVTESLAIRCGKTIEDEIQIYLITRFFDLVRPHKHFDHTIELLNINSWEERLSHIFDKLPDDIIYGKSYHKQFLSSSYNKIKMMIRYEGNSTGYLKSSTALIRPTKQIIPFTEDYGLSKYFELPVKVHIVEGNHYSIIGNRKTAELISQTSTLPEDNVYKSI